MLSTCPTCLAQVNHPDHLFDVTCECGNHFSPFQNFEESSNAFKDIIQFGENMSTDSINVDLPMQPISPGQETAQSVESPLEPSKPEGQVTAPAGTMLMAAASTLQGFSIETHFSPISVCVDIDLSQPNPLSAGFQKLWANALASGANAVVSLQFSLTSDQTKALLVGTPVRCQRNQ